MKTAWEIVLMSIGGVFLAMALLTALLYLLKILSQFVSSTREKKKESEPIEDEQTILLLTAAAYMALKKPVKIHRVHVHREPYVERWSYAGRMDIHLSHQKSGVNQ
ncbi:MAG: hypothetical protein N2445_03975 [Acidobacteria bacterium]|nr:hypothetical protein [Acidobacteriota bacterium]